MSEPLTKDDLSCICYSNCPHLKDYSKPCRSPIVDLKDLKSALENALDNLSEIEELEEFELRLIWGKIQKAFPAIYESEDK